MKRHEAFQAEKPTVTSFQKHSGRNEQTYNVKPVMSQGDWGSV